MLTYTGTRSLDSTIDKVEIYPAKSEYVSHIVQLKSVTLVFSTLILDVDMKMTILSKSDLYSHTIEQTNHLHPCFHFISVLHRNVGRNSLVVMDVGSDLHFSLQAGQNNISGEAAGIITLFNNNTKIYAPALCDDTFPHLSSVISVITSQGTISTARVSMVDCPLSRSYTIPTPDKRGNIFIPSFSFQEIFNQPLFDLSCYSFPYPSKNIIFLGKNESKLNLPGLADHNKLICSSGLANSNWGDKQLDDNKLSLPLLADHSKLLYPSGLNKEPNWNRQVLFDEIMSDTLYEYITENNLEQFHKKHVSFPFTMPANLNLHGLTIFPDKMVLPNTIKPIEILREYRSPCFTLIGYINFRSNSENQVEICTVTPKYLHIALNNKNILLGFQNLIATDYDLNLPMSQKMMIKCRRAVRFREPSIWNNDEVFLDFVISSMSPLDINIDNTPFPCKDKIIQNRVLNVPMIKDVPTVIEMSSQFDNLIIAPEGMDVDEEEIKMADTKLNTFLSQYEETKQNSNFLTTPCTTVCSDPSTHFLLNQGNFSNLVSPQLMQNLDTENTLLQGFLLPKKIEDQDKIKLNAQLFDNLPTFSVEGRNTQTENTGIDLKTKNDEKKLLDQGDPNQKVKEEGHIESNFSLVHPMSLQLPYFKNNLENESDYQLPYFKNNLENEGDSGNDIDEVFNPPLQIDLGNDSDDLEIDLLNQLKIQHITSPIGMPDFKNSIDEIGTGIYNCSLEEGRSKSPLLNTPPAEKHLGACPVSHYNTFPVLMENNCFLFENDKHVEFGKKEIQAPKLLAKIKLQNEAGNFEYCTALVDSGSDVTLITLNKLLSLVSQNYLDRHITQGNVKLTSFSNTGIQIVGLLKLKLKLYEGGPIKSWDFLVIQQNSIVDMILGNDLIMSLCMSIQIKTKNNPEIFLPNGKKVKTYYTRLNDLNKIKTEIYLNPRQKKIIKLPVHPGFSALSQERFLTEAASGFEHLVIPMASKLLTDGKLPVALWNRTNTPIKEMVELTLSKLSNEQQIVEMPETGELQKACLMVPVQISKNNEVLEIQAAEETTEKNVFKLNLKYNTTGPQSSFNGNKHSKFAAPEATNIERDEERGQLRYKRESKDPVSGNYPDKVSEEQKQGVSDNYHDKVSDEQRQGVSDNNKINYSDKVSEEQEGICPENFLKDLDGKYLPPGYEVLEKSDIRDIIKLEEYPPSLRAYIKDIFIDNYSQIVSKNDYEIGALSNTLGPIKLFLKPGTKLPPFKKIYYLEATQAQALKDILSYLMRENIIEECGPNCNTGFNGFSSPAYLVSKSNPGKSAYRLIVNYKNLNSNLLTAPPILPSIDQLLQKLKRGYLFSQFDLSSAFYSLRLCKESRKLTMFSTCFGSYRFKSLAMGLATAPGVFCNIANNLIHTLPKLDKHGKPIYSAPNLVILVPSPLEYCVIYFDDVCIFSPLKQSYEETLKLHFQYVKEVMSRLAFHEARIKWSKTALCKTDIIFLGHRISNGKAYADPKRVEKLINANFPTNLNLIRSFLGLINSLRTYLPPAMSRQVEILQELTKTKQGFNPKQSHRDAFEALKKMLTSEPLFTSIIDPAGKFYLFCDAASGAKASFSAVLTQVIKKDAEAYPPFLNICDPIHNYIHKNDLGYRPIPLYLSNEKICKSKVDKHIYDPIFLPSYYEKSDLGYKKQDLNRTWFIALQSIHYDAGCKLLNETEVRKEIILVCKKGLVFNKLKTFNFGGHHLKTKTYMTDFQEGAANIDNYMFTLEVAAEVIKRTIVVIILDEDERIQTKVFNPNDKQEIILGAYRQKNGYLFYPFKRVDMDNFKLADFQNKIQIVAFFSRTVPQTTSVLDIAQVEAIGILWTLDHFKKYIKMCRLTIITDNLVFFSILSRKVLDCSTLISRYALKILVQYPSTKIRFILTNHNLADFLTRENKIDKNTLLRLPLSAFKVSSALSKILDGKQEFTLLEFKDFADKHQNFILTDRDVMGRQKLSPLKIEQSQKGNTQTNCALTYSMESEEEYYNDYENGHFSFFLPDPDPSDSESATLLLTTYAITRSQLNTPSNKEILDPENISTANILPNPGLSKNLPKGENRLVHDSGKTSSSSMSSQKLRQLNKHRQFLKDNYSKLVPGGKLVENSIDINNSGQFLYLDPREKIFFDEPDPLPEISDPQHAAHSNDPSLLPSVDGHAPDPDNTNEIIDEWGKRAESELDQISEPKKIIERGKPKFVYQPNHFRFQYTLAKLLFAKTGREILIRQQREEFKEDYRKCLDSKDFRIPAPRGFFKLQEMLMYYIDEAGTEKIVLPPSLSPIVIGIYHLLTHHGGVKQMIFSLSHYYIPNLVKLLRLYTSSCYTCILNNVSKSSKLGHIPLIRPGYVVHLDLIEGLNSNKRYQHILVCVCPFSKFVLAHPIKAKTTDQILPFLVNTVFQVFNVKVLVTDGGGLFVSKDFRRVIKDLCIKHVPISSNHPQANGQAEAYVKIIKDKLRKLLTFDDNEEWLKNLPLVVKTLNTTVSGEYPCSPLELLYGPKDPNSLHVLTHPDIETDIIPPPPILDKQKALSKLINYYKKTMNKKMIKRKERVNKNLTLPDVKENSYIVIKDFAILKGINKTLHPKYKLEIFRVLKVKSRSVVARSLSTFQDKLISFSNLKVITTKNHSELNIPPVLSKLLLKDSKDLTFRDQTYIARKTGSNFLPEPDPDVLEDVSDDEMDFNEAKENKNVSFDLGANEIFDIPTL